MKRLACILALIVALSCPLVAVTTVTATLANADGTPFVGRVEITWPAFAAADGKIVPRGSKVVTVARGAFSTSLLATPAGVVYTVNYYAPSQRSGPEYWAVPESASPVTIASVITGTAATSPTSLIALSLLSSTGASAGHVVTFNGTSTVWAAPTVAWGAITGSLSGQSDLVSALAGKEAANANIQTHVSSTSNPHTVTKAQVGLGSVENTALSTWAGSVNITTLGTLVAGTVPWARLSDVPSTFTPSAHAASHAQGSADALSGTLNVSITGNAATVANGVVTTGSYADPAWVTSLAGSKVSGNIAGNAATATAVAWSGVTGKPILTSSEYTFTRTNGTDFNADLSAAGAKTVTLTSCPVGVAGANANHYLYISGGTGTAEAVLITGGTCTSGGTGTLQFTTAQTHGGSYTLTSATAGLREALAVAPTGRIFVPVGTHNVYAETVIAGGATIECASEPSTSIRANSATQNVFRIATTSKVEVSNCRIATAVTKTAGAGIKIDTSANGYSIFRGNRIEYQYIGIQSETGFGLSIQNNYIVSSALHGISIRNTVTPDQGDSLIFSNTFDSPVATGAAIFQASSGGLRVIGNKTLQHAYGFDFLLDDGANTSNLLIESNSIEGFTAGGIRIRKGGSGSFSRIIINGNQFAANASASTCIHIGAGLSEVVISGNHFTSKGLLLEGDRMSVSDNIFNTATTGIDPSTGTNITAVNNQMYGVTTRYGASANQLMVVDLFNPFTHSQLVALRIGSQIYCTDCTVASPCASGGTGAFAKRIAGAWVCN